MKIFSGVPNINFMAQRKTGLWVSAFVTVASILLVLLRGLNFGIDFTGGVLVEVHYPQTVHLDSVRADLARAHYENPVVQFFGTSSDVLIRLPPTQETNSAKVSTTILDALHASEPKVELRRIEFVGPQVGGELVESGALALLFVSLGIVAYLAIRFEWKFGLAAIIANLHDVVIILGCFALFQWEFSLTVLAAILAILGYSVNESVVVFDRIRENFRKMRKASVTAVIDNAITRTMSRTIITHGCTQLMVTSMLLFGGETLHYFALALTIGICFGIYSSVLVASPIVMWLRVTREDLVKPEKKAETIGAAF